MEIPEIKKEIHDYIDHADDRFLRLVYSMVENEKTEAGSDFFSTTSEDMKKRAEASLLSVEEGRIRHIKDLKKDIHSWKKRQSTR